MAIIDNLPSAVKATVSIPSKWLQQYNSFILSNQPSISTIETSLRSLTYLIPHRYSDASLLSESIQSGSNLLGLYHTSVLEHDDDPLNPHSHSPLHPATVERNAKLATRNRYTDGWTRRSSMYGKLAAGLQVVQYTELLVEMAARRRGRKTQARVVFLLELVKAVIRILLFKLTQNRMVVWPPRPERREIVAAGPGTTTLAERREQPLSDSEWHDAKDDLTATTVIEPAAGPSTVSAEKPATATVTVEAESPPTPPLSESGAIAASTTSLDSTAPYIGKRTGIMIEPLPPAGTDISAFFAARLPDNPAEAFTAPTSLMRPLKTTEGVLSEYLYILRPLAFCILSQWIADHQSPAFLSSTRPPDSASTSRVSRMLRSRVAKWSPWLVGLAMEYASRQLLKAEWRKRGSTKGEREELRRRGWNTVWWGMRGACWEEFARAGVEGAAGRVERVPLVGGILGGALREYSALWGSYWFATSTM